MDEEMIPFPNEEVTPPVTKIYLVFVIMILVGGKVPWQNYGNFLRFGRVHSSWIVFFLNNIRFAYPALDGNDF